MNFAKGQEFTNKNGVKIKILSVDKQHDYILIQIGNDKKDVTFHGLEAIISKNGYAKDSVKCALDKAIRTLDRDRIIKFPSEREAIEYCKENKIDPRKIFIMGTLYAIREPIQMNRYAVTVIWENEKGERMNYKEIVMAENSIQAELKVKNMQTYRNKNIKLIKVN